MNLNVELYNFKKLFFYVVIKLLSTVEPEDKKVISSGGARVDQMLRRFKI